MGYTREDAWEEEAYERMVDGILEHHRDEIIDGFVAERMASYYRQNPDLALPAEKVLEEAIKLRSLSPSACLVFARSAMEITLRDVLLKPIAFGLVHDESKGAQITDLVIGNRGFTKLLVSILSEYGFDVRDRKRKGSSKSIWEEMEDIGKLRNEIVHKGASATAEEADLAVRIAKFLLHKLYPGVREQHAGR